MHAPKRHKLANGAVGSAAGSAASNAAAAFSSASGSSAPGFASGSSIAAAAPVAASPAHRFLSHLLLLSTAQLAAHAKFTVCRRSTLGALGEVAARYIESIGVNASQSANAANRSEVTLHDVLYGLSEMGVTFSEMREWQGVEREISFGHPPPAFPRVQEVVLVEPTPMPNGPAAITAPTRPPHIPPCLPALPAKRTYAYTPEMRGVSSDIGGSGGDVGVVRKRKVDENRKLEAALVKLHQAATKAALQMAIEAENELRMPPPDKPAAPQPPTGVSAPQTKPRNVVVAPLPPRAPVHMNNAPADASLSSTVAASSSSATVAASASATVAPAGLPATAVLPDTSGATPMEIDETPSAAAATPAATSATAVEPAVELKTEPTAATAAAAALPTTTTTTTPAAGATTPESGPAPAAAVKPEPITAAAVSTEAATEMKTEPTADAAGPPPAAL